MTTLLSRTTGFERASLLAELGDLTTLTVRSDNGDPHAASRLAQLLAERGDLTTTLTTRADNGDPHAAIRLAQPPGDRGDLAALADLGDTHAAELLAELLADRKLNGPSGST